MSSESQIGATQQEGNKPKRAVKVTLICDEETNGACNGLEWLAANKRDLITTMECEKSNFCFDNQNNLHGGAISEFNNSYQLNIIAK